MNSFSMTNPGLIKLLQCLLQYQQNVHALHDLKNETTLTALMRTALTLMRCGKNFGDVTHKHNHSTTNNAYYCGTAAHIHWLCCTNSGTFSSAKIVTQTYKTFKLESWYHWTKK